MRRVLSKIFIFVCIPIVLFAHHPNELTNTDVLIIGGGASGTMAAIQAARMGVSVIIVEETPWLGGMLTSAGVSAVDGNYNLHSGLWEEFRQALNRYYGGVENLKTGWVSNVLFEPNVGAEILRNMVASENNITVLFESDWKNVIRTNDGWTVSLVDNNKKTREINTKILIDASELGDVAAKVGIPYDIGMDSRNDSGEEIAPEIANNIVQDLTYVAILKEFGDSAKAALTKPGDYNSEPFLCTCATGFCQNGDPNRKLWDCDHMMKYGKLPNGYYMINWPISGNDYYVNIIEMTMEERKIALQKAKDFTLNYVYYLQNELGFSTLGIADDVFPTPDGLPFIPYHRESRRIKGLVRFTVNDLARPFLQEQPLYRTGIAVGDYPVDHHHKAYLETDQIPDLHFYPVPSYSIPLGSLIPQDFDDFIVSEKSISVSNIVNGTTRLQPVCILIGQASGVLAAIAVKEKITPEKVSIRKVQKELLNSNCYILPYSDVKIDNPAFRAIQKVGATGILKGEGKNIGWKNHTHIYPDSLLTSAALKTGLEDWLKLDTNVLKNEYVTLDMVLNVLLRLASKYKKENWIKSKAKINEKAQNILSGYGYANLGLTDVLNRAIFAVLLDELINPFDLRDVDHFGNFIEISTE